MESRDRIMKEANFWTSRVILTAAELDVFTHLDDGPTTALQCAERIGTNPRATERLLNALVALDLLEKREDLFVLSADGKLLSLKHPETMLPSLLHYAELWESWSQLTTVVRTGKPVQRSARVMSEASRRAFIGAMDIAGRGLSRRIAESFDVTRHRRLLDIGGASGTYTIAFLQKNLSMTAVLFDLPPVVDIAQERIAAEGLADKVLLVKGDYKVDAFPDGCDLALLSAIIHQNSPSENLDLFDKINRALEPGGTLLIRDFIMDSTRTVPKGGTLFALNMLVNTVGGDTYTFDEISQQLRQVGFADVELIRGNGQQSDLVKAEKT
jgi:SAM-dependent methyltransferase